MSKGQSTKVARVCAVCGDPFLVHPCQIKIGNGKFCSQACYHKSHAVPLIDRFFHYVGPKTETGCILWAGTTNRDGYGVIGSGTRKGRMLLANRVSYELLIGPIPDGLLVLHRCDNPPCINPAHLFLGTHAVNAADKVAKARQPRGENIPWSRLTEQKVLAIREKYATGGATYDGLAAEYGVSYNVIRCVVRRETWKHV